MSLENLGSVAVTAGLNMTEGSTREPRLPSASQADTRMTNPPSELFDARPYRSIPLARPLAVFGKRFNVLLTTGITFSPATLLNAICELTPPSGHRRRDSSWKNYVASALGIRPASNSTRSLYRREIQAGVAPADLELVVNSCLSGKVPLSAHRPFSIWHGWANGLVEDFELWSVCRLAAWLDDSAQLADDMARQGREHEAREALGVVLGSSTSALEQLLPQSAFMAIESALHVVRQYEHFFQRTLEPLDRETSLFARALAPGATPIGHWIAEFGVASGCPSNGAIARLMFKRDVRLHGRCISEAQLKNWSCGRQRMPVKAMQEMLSQLQSANFESSMATLTERFYLAQLAIFLCDVFRAIAFEAAGWSEAQAHLLARYNVLRLEENHWRKATSS